MPRPRRRAEPPDTGRSTIHRRRRRQSTVYAPSRCTGQVCPRECGIRRPPLRVTVLENTGSHISAPLPDPLSANIEWGAMSDDPGSLRLAAFELYRRGNYVSAQRTLRALLAGGSNRPSTLCHLARIDLMLDDFTSAGENADAAWQSRSDGPDYVVARALWLLIAVAMLREPHRPLQKLIGQLMTALQTCGSCTWEMEPVLHRLQNQLGEQQHALLSALAAAISNGSDIAAIEKLYRLGTWRHGRSITNFNRTNNENLFESAEVRK